MSSWISVLCGSHTHLWGQAARLNRLWDPEGLSRGVGPCLDQARLGIPWQEVSSPAEAGFPGRRTSPLPWEPDAMSRTRSLVSLRTLSWDLGGAPVGAIAVQGD